MFVTHVCLISLILLSCIRPKIRLITNLHAMKSSCLRIQPFINMTSSKKFSHFQNIAHQNRPITDIVGIWKLAAFPKEFTQSVMSMNLNGCKCWLQTLFVAQSFQPHWFQITAFVVLVSTGGIINSNSFSYTFLMLLNSTHWPRVICQKFDEEGKA